MAGCICDVPRPFSHRPQSCRNCGRYIDPAYLSNDQNVESFASYLRSLPDVDDSFIRYVKGVEAQTRRERGYDYLEGDARSKGLALAAELALQSHFYLLWCKRNNHEANLGAAMEAASFAAKAWEAMKRI